MYHPTESLVQHIASYAGQVDKLYLVDNSEPPNFELGRRLMASGTVEYLPQGENLGVARALNIGARLAIDDGYTFLLTMDQDSVATPTMVHTMLNCLKDNALDSFGIIAPFHSLLSEPNSERRGCDETDVVLTSGNLLNLRAYEKVGPFIDDFFIDMVDIEYCLRLRFNGYIILRCYDALLKHNLGNISKHCYRGRTVCVSNHPPLRRYYMARNRFYLNDHYRLYYPEFCSQQFRQLLGEIKGIILFEENKIDKLRMTLKGYLDYRRGRMGRFLE